MIINGLLTNPSEGVAKSIDVAPGSFLFGGNVSVFPAGISKRVDLPWASGHNQGGLDAGSIAPNSGYFVWLIGDASTGVFDDVLISAAAVNPELPSGYDAKVYLFAFLTDNAGEIFPYSQKGGYCDLRSPITLSFGDIKGGNLLTKSAGVPAGKKFLAKILLATSSASAGYVAMKDPDDGTGSVIANAVFYQPASVVSSGLADIWTNPAGQILVGGGQTTVVATNAILRGWFDDRVNP